MTKRYAFLASGDEIIYSTISVAQVLLGSILNGCVIYLFQRNCHLLEIPSNLILFNMSIMDFISCFFLLPYEIYMVVYKKYGMLDYVPKVILFFTLNVSMNGAVLMSVDRLLTIIYPLRYYTVVTATRIRRILAFIWFLSFFSCILLYLSIVHSISEFEYFIAFKDMICCLIICVSYSILCYIANKQVHKITPKDGRTTGQYRRLVCKRSLKSAKRSGVVVFFFLLSSVPFVFLHLYFNFTIRRDNNEALFWSFTLLFWQSSLNPLLFCVFSDKLRALARQSFCSPR